MKYLRNVLVPVAGAAAVLTGVVLCAPAVADVTAHGDDGVPGRPVVILEIRLVDSGDPIGSIAERGETIEVLSDSSDPVRRMTEDGEPPHAIWQSLLHPAAGHRPLNVQGFDRKDDRPAIVVGAGRIPHAVWARAAVSGYDLVASRYVHGDWTSPIVVSSHVGHDLGASLAVDSTGALHLAYWVLDRDGARVEYRSAGATGTSWSEPVVVSPAGEVAARPSIVAAAGRVLIAYESHVAGFGSTPRQIVVAEKTDFVWSSDVVATTNHPGPNRPGIHAGRGRIWMEWIDADDRMCWTCRAADGRWTPLDTEPFEGLEDRDYHVRGRIKAAAVPADEPD